MSTKPLIAVAGAAGKQGRSVAAALLRSGGGRARSHPKSECLTGASPGAGGCGGRRCAAPSGTGGDMAKGLSRSRRRFFDDAAHAAGELRRIRTRMPPG